MKFKLQNRNLKKTIETLYARNIVVWNVVVLSWVLLISFQLIRGRVMIENGFWFLTFNISFIDPSTAFAESLINLYNILWFLLLIIVVFILVLLIRIVYLFSWKANFYYFRAIKTIFDFFIIFSLKFFIILEDYLIVKQLIKILNKINLYKIFTVWYSNNKYEFLKISELSEYKNLEVTWCAIPSLGLISLIGPTFTLIYSVDSDIDPVFTVKVVGHQWYWNYSYDIQYSSPIKGYKTELMRETVKYMKSINFDNLDTMSLMTYENCNKFLFSLYKYDNTCSFSFEFDSVMIQEQDLVEGTHRLLEVDNRLVLPIGVPIRFLITSVDVLHSWAVPSLGVKVDAVPGRLNQFVLEIKHPGVFYGQCSELCGPLHGFMPIVVEAVTLDNFETWLLKITNN